MELRSHYQVVVIGGGVGGCYAGYLIAKKGLSVLVVERAPQLGMPVNCGEGISEVGLSDFLPPRDSWIRMRIEGAKLVGPTGRVVKVAHPDAGYILDKAALVEDVAAMCESEGGEVMTNLLATELRSAEHDGAFESVGVMQDGEGRWIDFDYLIGADGVSSQVAKAAGIDSSLRLDQLFSTIQYRVAKIDIDEPSYPEFHVGAEVAPGGYAWVFPRSASSANVGLGIAGELLQHKELSKHLHKFIAKRFDTYQLGILSGGVVPAAGMLKNPGKKNLLLIGDAGHFTDPLSGAGIANAFLTAQIASDIIQKIDENGKNRNKAADDYIREVDRILKRKLKAHLLAKDVYTKLDDHDLKEIIDFIDEEYGGQVYTSIDTIEFIKNIFLHKPKLLKLGAYGIGSFLKDLTRIFHKPALR